jgi:hypothetical protein
MNLLFRVLRFIQTNYFAMPVARRAIFLSGAVMLVLILLASNSMQPTMAEPISSLQPVVNSNAPALFQQVAGPPVRIIFNTNGRQALLGEDPPTPSPTPSSSPTPTPDTTNPDVTPTEPPDPTNTPFPLLITTVNGRFFPNPTNSGAFEVTTATPAVFSEQFPVVAFNPPDGVTLVCSHTANQETRPFTDVIPGTPGTPCAEQPAQFPWPGTPTVSAGVGGSLDAFQAVFTGQFYASESGEVTFKFWSDDGWVLSIGPKVSGTGEQPSYVIGDFDPPTPAAGTPWPTGPFTQYRVVGRFNKVTGVTTRAVTVNFPAAGYYPFELDYSECCGGQLSLLMGTTAGNMIPPGPSATPVINELRAVAVIGQNATSLVTPPALPTPYKVLNLWAVGTSSGQSLVRRGDTSNPSGVTWTDVTVPNVGPLNGVTTAKRSTDRWDAWAAGDNGILHYDTNQIHPSWQIDSGATGANAIVAKAIDEVWAVGINSSIQKYDGSTWSTQTSTGVPAGATLMGVALNTDGLRIVGYTGSAANHNRQPLFVRNASGTWSHLIATDAGSDAFLNAVDVYNSDYAWAVGSQLDSNGHYRALIYHKALGDWFQADLGADVNPGTTYNELRSVWITGAGGVWAAGRYSDAAGSPPPLASMKPYLLRWSDSNDGWVRVDAEPPGPVGQLLSVATIPHTDAVLTTTWAVGSFQADPNVGVTQPWITEVKKAPTPPAHTTSYYMGSLIADHSNPKSQYALGCRAAQNHESGIVVLDFGATRNLGTTQAPRYGTVLLSGTPVPIGGPTLGALNITQAVEEFVDGYAACYPSGWSGGITVALGINNYSKDDNGDPDPAAQLTAAHAQAWAALVDEVHDYALQYGSKITAVAGAFDAEPNFAPWADQTHQTRAFDTPAGNSTYTWANNFRPQHGFPFYYNFGSTDGYPSPAGGGIDPADTCCSGWTARQLYNISFGLSNALLIPEIYKPQFTRNWHRLKRWSMETSPAVLELQFAGLMSDCFAVLRSAGCTQLESTALKNKDLADFHFTNTQAWQTFWHELHSDPATSAYLQSTDIQWSDR